MSAIHAMSDHLLPTYARFPVEFARGEGTRLWDAEGNEYLDCLTGISVSSVGHCHPKVVEAIRDQAGRLLHVSNLYFTEPMTRLADRLATSSLGGGRAPRAPVRVAAQRLRVRAISRGA